MSFINDRLPREIELGAVRTDEDDIEIVPTDGGEEFRNARSDQSVLTFEVAYPISCRDDANYLAVRRLFKVARQGLHGFRFWDWSEHDAVDEPIAVGDGVTADLQLVLNYAAGSDTEQRRITRPVTPIQILKDGVVQPGGWTVDYDTGVVTLTSPAAWNGTVISWSGEFDIPVRFDSPLKLVGETEDLDRIESVTVVELVE